MELLNRLKNEILILDGALGTRILDLHLKDRCMEYLNITNPEIEKGNMYNQSANVRGNIEKKLPNTV